MTNSQFLMELFALIPARNINFYIDTYMATRTIAVGKQDALSALIDRARANYNTIVTDSMKLVGYFILSQFGGSEADKRECFIEKLPDYFLSVAIIKDLNLQRQAVSNSFVDRVFSELKEQEIVHSGFQRVSIEESGLTEQDMAELFLGFSLAAKGAMIPIVPFPAYPAGYAARLASELRKLLPIGSPFLDWSRRKTCSRK